MKHTLLGLALTASLSLSGVAMAADAYSEAEIHLARGIADKTNLLLAVNDLAAAQSSNPEIKAFAAKMADQYAAALTAFAKQAEAVGISNVAPPRGANGGGAPGALPPEASQGNGMGTGGMGAAPNGQGQNGSGPPGGAQSGNPPQGGAGGPGGQGGPGGNGGGNPKEKMITLVKDRISQFKGTQFDEVYLLTVLQVTENLERQVMAELMTPTSNKALVEASKQYIQSFAENAILIQQMLTRSGVDKIPEQPGKNNEQERSRLSIGDLFGLTIKN